jgi:hypothetical protein
VRGGALFAKDLSAGMMEGLGNIVGDLLEDLSVFKRRGLREREEALELFEDKLSLDRAKARGWSTTPSPELLQENIRRLTNEDLGNLSEASDIFKKIMEGLLFGAKNAMLLAGASESEAAELLGTFEIVLNTALNAAISQNALGASSELVKLGIKSTAGLVFDGPVYSFTKNSEDLVTFSEQRMQSWATVDPIEYAANRERVLSILRDMGKEATFVLQTLQFTTAAPDAIGVTENIAELTGVGPAEILIKVIKYLDNAATFGLPAALVYYEIPKFMDQGVYKAYGQLAPQGKIRAFATSPPTGTIDGSMIAEASAKKAALNNLLKQIPSRLGTNDFSEAIELLAGTNQPSVATLHREFQTALDANYAQAKSVSSTNQDLAKWISAMPVAQAQARAAIATLFSLMTDISLKAFTLVYSGPSDPRYLADRNRLLNALTNAPDALDNANSIASSLFSSTPFRVVPTVFVSGLSIVSETTGRSEINGSPEDFIVRAHVRNISTLPLSDISARIQIEGTNPPIQLLSGQAQEIGGLMTDDRATGSGGDEANLTWRFRYNGGTNNVSPIFVSINLLEKGTNAHNFRVDSRNAVLTYPDRLKDRDFDGLPDAYEAAVGLDPLVKDALLDLDGDGLSNLREFELATNPNNADSDGDGLSDLEEVTPGRDRSVTNPLAKDSDDDGTIDSLDLEPNIRGTEGTAFHYPARNLQLTPGVVYLSRTQTFARIKVSPISGPLSSWTARPVEAALLHTVPEWPDTRTDADLLISSSGYTDFASPVVVITSVKVVDIAAGTEQDVLVVINGTAGTGSSVGVSISNGRITLRWNAEAQTAYQIQFSPDLKNWNNANEGLFLSMPQARELTWSENFVPSGKTAQFYRLVPVKM